MTDPLFVQTDGVRKYSELHSQVVSGLSGLTGAEGTGVQHSHGAIASAVSGALNDVLGGRGSTLGVTSTTASTIADLLQKAAGAYAAGDEEGASRLKAAAEALEGKGEAGWQRRCPRNPRRGRIERPGRRWRRRHDGADGPDPGPGRSTGRPAGPVRHRPAAGPGPRSAAGAATDHAGSSASHPTSRPGGAGRRARQGREARRRTRRQG